MRIDSLFLVAALANCNWTASSADPKPAKEALEVKLYNCNDINGRAYNVFTRVNDGEWTPRGALNPVDSDKCDDAPHEGASLTVGIRDPAGKWEFRLIKLPRSAEPDCDSSAPEVSNACSFLTLTYQTDVEGGTKVEKIEENTP